jgi:hypothetical protein
MGQGGTIFFVVDAVAGSVIFFEALSFIEMILGLVLAAAVMMILRAATGVVVRPAPPLRGFHPFRRMARRQFIIFPATGSHP